MLIIKIILSSLIIISLALVAQRVSSKVAGLLSALPMGTALVLFFYGLEYGSSYVAEVSSFNILGLSASLIFVLFYYLGAKLFEDNTKSILSAISISLIAYFITAFSLSMIEVKSALLPSLILLSVVFISFYIFRNIKDTKVKNSKKVSTTQLILRSFVATGFIVFISFAPEYLPSSLAGVISSFPSVVVPLLLILHISFGKDSVFEAIKVMPLSYISILIYSLSIGYSYLTFGVYLGTLVSFIISIVYILVLLYFTSVLAKAKIRTQVKTL